MDILLGQVKEDSPLYKVDARVKLLAILVFVAFTSTLKALPVLGFATFFMLGLAAAARITPGIIIKRLAWVIPFAGGMIVFFPFIIPGEAVLHMNFGLFTLTATDKGVAHAVMLSLRVFVAVMAVTLLVSTTKFNDLTCALRNLKVPVIFVELIEFTIRYIFVLTDEVARMKTARRARNFQNGGSLLSRHTFKTLGQTVAVLFIRSYERGDRIYNAMLARCYSGQVRTNEQFSLRTADWCWGLSIAVAGVCLRLAEFGGVVWPTLLK